MLLGDKEQTEDDVYLKEAMLNTAAGEFLEARNDLPRGWPTTIFTKGKSLAMSSNGSGFDYDENQKGAETNPCLEKWRITVSALLCLGGPFQAAEPLCDSTQVHR